MIRVVIAAASPVLRAGLENLVASSPGIELAGAFPDLASVDDLRPDVVLAAVALDDLSPPAGDYRPAIVMLAAGPPPRWSADTLRLGVRAILPPEATAGEILSAVETAAGGRVVIDPEELESLLGSEPPALEETPVLTARELEVLRMMAEGAANKTIAWKLGISEHTVKFHVASILGKFGAGSRTEAVTAGIRRGLIML